MGRLKLDFATVVKLIIWSMVVGALLYWLNISTGDIYGWIIDKLARIWAWLSGTGLKYMLLGATIVVPVFVISRLRKG